ncbi:ATP phosphoribosyltransferase (ATP-PRTase) (ATP-PRT) [Orbilia oligospora]|uniref:ATP phosphoribosyltransferase n=1 Tax=Orbilia oligospora TaxID=2813651 RepID=A0A6G1MBT9_ORBOL|nr:ATP phosphoribosyltransferase (ATP-PRTase) (ATP-PRT) [Orbilia oligospora]KAF3213763.1 ATP phosphoribosyltransferase (ATP-PRTase) (ATP-PRT) [Orbilia oligospora]KAF3219019.1 ATP phosphoribosyltransferase (ATP-PRTase) (ATP-PRT) [Orbilia oligospora]KAF3224710.1 ATP phosphoribosyltransferase (ATP-PRTase) (ATP-PRT) [Orbilia oligospora]KAF3251452.1 ATP phosphoribosyltransferase (ATP-PRTase) (ATP-PRT) [Orbilia oligospora]
MELVNSLDGRLLMAVPKKGRLHDAALTLLQGSDIQFHRHNRLDIALCHNLPIALVFLGAGDIPVFVGEGRCDLGITGQDQVAEHQISVEEILELGFGKCKLQVQVPANGPIKDPKELIGKTVVTSFTHLSRDYFKSLEVETFGAEAVEKNGMKTTMKYVGGSVEAACALGVADGIVDLVESGETMKAAGLAAISTVMTTEAVLIKSKHPRNPQMAELVLSRIKGVINAKKYVLCSYNIPRTLLSVVHDITPGRRAPTITSLEEEGWVAVQAMVERSRVASVMDQLDEAGAHDILVMQISNSRVGKH